MGWKYRWMGTQIGVLFLLGTVVLAGPMNSPGEPADPPSKSYNLEDTYKRLEAGTEGSQHHAFITRLPFHPQLHAWRSSSGLMGV